MAIENKIFSGTVGNEYKGYIKFDKDMVSIFDTTAKTASDKASTTNLLVYVLNDLNYALENNPELKELTIEIEMEDVKKALYYNPLTRKTSYTGTTKDRQTKIDKAMKLIEDLKKVSGVYVFRRKDIQFIPVYSIIQVSTEDMNAPVVMKLNSDFINYFNEVRNRDGVNGTYGKLYFDIMLALSTYYQKIVYAYIAGELEKYDSTNWTNVISLIKHMGVKHRDLKQRVEEAIIAINKVVEYKREKYQLFIPKYKVEWKHLDPNVTTGPNAKLLQFKFSIDFEDVKANKDKYKKKESYEQIICDFTNYEPLRESLRQWISKGKEANELPSMKSFKTQLENLREGVGEDEAILDIIEQAEIYGNYRSLGYKKEVAEHRI